MASGMSRGCRWIRRIEIEELDVSVRIRMKRFGRKNRPFYRVCVIDRRKARDGKPIEEVGTYDPMVYDKAKRVTLNLERIEYWMSVGAQPSEHVATLIKKVKTNKFGTAKAAAPAPKPKELPVAAPAEGAVAEGGASEGGETPAAE